MRVPEGAVQDCKDFMFNEIILVYHIFLVFNHGVLFYIMIQSISPVSRFKPEECDKDAHDPRKKQGDELNS